MEKFCCRRWSRIAKKTAQIIDCNSVSQFFNLNDTWRLWRTRPHWSDDCGDFAETSSWTQTASTSDQLQTPTAAHETRYLNQSGSASPGSSLWLWIPQLEETICGPEMFSLGAASEVCGLYHGKNPACFPSCPYPAPPSISPVAKEKQRKRCVTLWLKWKSAQHKISGYLQT